jgi:hypothetical protein
MVEETEGGDALPLLAYTLLQLYERARGRASGEITVDDYEAVGGVGGALQRQADRVVKELAARGEADQILPTLLKLVTVQGEGEPTRRRLPRSCCTTTRARSPKPSSTLGSDQQRNWR